MNANPRPARVVPPGRILRRELETRGWTQKDLAAIIQRPEKSISQMVNGHKRITPETALELAAALGTSAELWLNLEAGYRLRLAQQEHETADIERKSRLYDLLPMAELNKRGWVSAQESVEELERDVSAFLGVASLDEQPHLAARFRQTWGREPQALAEVAWVRRVEYLSAEQQVESFDRDRLIAGIPTLLALSTAPERAADVPALLKSLGVHFVIVPHLPRTYLDGASLATTGNPIVALTLRYDRLDHFWFTLLHELAHVVAGHAGGYLDDLDRQAQNREEDEANRMARDWLIAPQALEAFVRATAPYFSKAKVCAFAEGQGRHPAIIVGRLQHEGHISYKNLRMLLTSVRKTLEPWTDTKGV